MVKVLQGTRYQSQKKPVEQFRIYTNSRDDKKQELGRRAAVCGVRRAACSAGYDPVFIVHSFRKSHTRTPGSLAGTWGTCCVLGLAQITEYGVLGENYIECEG